MAPPEVGGSAKVRIKCGQDGSVHPPAATPAPPGPCCPWDTRRRVPGYASLQCLSWGPLPGPTLYACRTPPLSAMFSPSVLNPFTCTQDPGWLGSPGLPTPDRVQELGKARAGGAGPRRRQGHSRFGCLPGPRSSSRTGGPCTPTAPGSAGPRNCSTNPACSHPCQSYGLGRHRWAAHSASRLPQPASRGPPRSQYLELLWEQGVWALKGVAA